MVYFVNSFEIEIKYMYSLNNRAQHYRLINGFYLCLKCMIKNISTNKRIFLKNHRIDIYLNILS